MERQMTVLTDVALITCIVQRGRGDIVVHAAQEAGAHGATVYFAKGAGIRDRLGILGVAIEVEKEIVNVVCATDQVTRVFERMYLAGELDAPGMGFMYVTPLDKAATYVPEEVVQKYASRKGGRRG